MRLSFSLALLVFVTCAPTQAQEWTRFRGPNGTGVIEKYEMPATWTKNDYLWSITLPGSGHSSPVVWGNKVFVNCANSDGLQTVMCLNAANGSVVWKKSYQSRPYRTHKFNSLASSSPTVDAKMVYFTWGSPESVKLQALDHDGNEVWNRDLGRFVSQHGYGASPMLVDDLLVLSFSQQEEQVRGGAPGVSLMLALNRRTGKDVWKSPRKSVRVCYSVPCVRETENGGTELVCYNTGDGVYGLDVKTGKQNWVARDVLSMRAVSSPIIAGGLVFSSTGSGGGGNYVAAVKPGKGAKVVYKMANSKAAPYVPSPVAKGELVFLFSDAGMVTCLDATSGTVHWQERQSRGFFGSPIRVRDKLYCIDREGTVHVLAAEKTYKELAKIDLGEVSYATPAVSDGRMYLRTMSKLHCLGGKRL